MATRKKTRRAPKLKAERLGPKPWQRTVLSIANVAWEDGGRAAVFNSSEERAAVKRLAAHGYMKIGHSHRDEITASITIKGHLLLAALRMENV
jgi:hypothetical protein